MKNQKTIKILGAICIVYALAGNDTETARKEFSCGESFLSVFEKI